MPNSTYILYVCIYIYSDPFMWLGYPEVTTNPHSAWGPPCSWDVLASPGGARYNLGRWTRHSMAICDWLVVSTPLKNIIRLGWLFPIYGKIKNVPNHQPGDIKTMAILKIPWQRICFTFYKQRCKVRGNTTNHHRVITQYCRAWNQSMNPQNSIFLIWATVVSMISMCDCVGALTSHELSKCFVCWYVRFHFLGPTWSSLLQIPRRRTLEAACWKKTHTVSL